jgi:hypothetical protein
MVTSSDKRAGRRFFRRPVCLLALGLAMGLGAVGAVAAVVLPARPAADSSSSLSLRAAPSSRTVAPGSTARYALNVARAQLGGVGLSGLTSLSMKKDDLPAGADVSFSPQRSLVSPRPFRQRTTLTVTTAATTPPGAYTLRVRARRPHRSGSTAVRLVVTPPDGASVSPSTAAPAPEVPVSSPEAFTIAGTVPVALTPGTGHPLDLTLTNLEDFDLSISKLEVAVASVSVPETDPSLSCGTGDFAVEQFSGATGFTLPAKSSASLSGLGFAAAELPVVSMLNLPVNQDGCKAASFSLAFAGTATEVTP